MINYTTGDATSPQVEGNKIIVHVCNDIGAWGAGFVMALSKKWDQPEKQYKRLSAKKRKVGHVQMVVVEKDVQVANIIGQNGTTRNSEGCPPVNYAAIELGLKQVANWAKTTDASIHMPRIGCGLAGGTWSIVEAVIKSAVPEDIPVYVYDFVNTNDPNYVKANI